VQVRPVDGETVVSYVFRLADANGFARPTTLLRAIGEPIAKNVHAGILDHHDITLNTAGCRRSPPQSASQPLDGRCVHPTYRRGR
jgi:hypothetical protein